MTTFYIEPLTDAAGTKYWVLFEHGQFHNPTAVIEDAEMKPIARTVLGNVIGMSAIPAVKEKLKEIREERGLTQADVARIMGLSSPAAISHYENGQRSVDLSTLNQWAAALGYYLEIRLMEK